MKNKLLLSIALCFLVTPITAMAAEEGDPCYKPLSSSSSSSSSSSLESTHASNLLSGSLGREGKGSDGEDSSARIHDLERKLALSEKALQDANASRERLEQAYTEDRLRALAYAATVNNKVLWQDILISGRQGESDQVGGPELGRRVAAFMLAGLHYSFSPETLAEWGINLPDSNSFANDNAYQGIINSFENQRQFAVRAVETNPQAAPVERVNPNLQRNQRQLENNVRVERYPALPNAVDCSQTVRDAVLSSTLPPLTSSLPSLMDGLEGKKGKDVSVDGPGDAPADKRINLDESAVEEFHLNNIKARRLASVANFEDKEGKGIFVDNSRDVPANKGIKPDKRRTREELHMRNVLAHRQALGVTRAIQEDKGGEYAPNVFALSDVLLANITLYRAPNNGVYLADKIYPTIQFKNLVLTLRIGKDTPENLTSADIVTLVNSYPAMQVLDLSHVTKPLNPSENLYLRGKPIDVSPLAGLRELRILDLSYAPVTGLSSLMKAPNLQVLYLKQTISNHKLPLNKPKTSSRIQSQESLRNDSQGVLPPASRVCSDIITPTNSIEWHTTTLITPMSLTQDQVLEGASFQIVTDVTFREHIIFEFLAHHFGLLPNVLQQIIDSYVGQELYVVNKNAVSRDINAVSRGRGRIRALGS